ncbi:MAG TPA: chemotaxis protein CheA [Longimicrobiales bacterium]|nr:chemotaxis protein CheA [Longimicrobiales bacterium]
MQLSRYLDLYLAETQEHLRGLDRSLLRLEESGDAAALEEAFRSVHTIKGMSASMGFGAVADLAHELEDRLDGVRQGRARVDPALIDALLEGADRLGRGVDAAVATHQGGVEADEAEAVPASDARVTPAAAPPPRRRRVADAPDGSKLIVRVHFHRDAPLIAARATLAIRNADGVAPVLATDPKEPGDAFDGELTLFVGGEPQQEQLGAAIRAAGEVASVDFEELSEEKIADARARAAAAKLGAAGVPGAVEHAERRGRFLRVELRNLDHLADGIAELAIVQRGIMVATTETGAEDRLDELHARASHLVQELQTGILAVRMVPVREMFDRFPRVVRDTARRMERLVDFRIEGHGIELDRTILDEIADPLVHLLRNAIGHGIEPPAERLAAGKPERGTLTLIAERERSRVLIRVIDDGRGVDRKAVRLRGIEMGLLPADAPAELDDRELLRVLSAPGLTTAESVTAVSGRGVGLDVVAERVRALGGSLDLRSTPRGSTFDIRLPLTLTIAQALRVQVGDEDYVIPLTHVAEAVALRPGMSEQAGGSEVLRLREEVMPLLRLDARLGMSVNDASAAAVVIEVGERRTGLVVDRLVGREQIVIKEFDTAKGTLPIFSGATLLADGTPALVLDPVSVTQGGFVHG